MSLTINKNVCSNARQLAERFLGGASSSNCSKKLGERVYLRTDKPGQIRIKSYKWGDNKERICIEKEIGRHDDDVYVSLVDRIRDRSTGVTTTTSSFKSAIDNFTEKVVRTVRKNGKKESTTRYRISDENNFPASIELTPAEFYKRCAKKTIQDKINNTTDAIQDFLDTLPFSIRIK